jgi:hypothetical protein
MSTTKKGKALRPSFLHDFTSVISSRIKYVSKFIFSTPYRYCKPVCSTELFRGLTVPCTLPYGQNRCGNNIRLFVGHCGRSIFRFMGHHLCKPYTDNVLLEIQGVQAGTAKKWKKN